MKVLRLIHAVTLSTLFFLFIVPASASCEALNLRPNSITWDETSPGIYDILVEVQEEYVDTTPAYDVAIQLSKNGTLVDTKYLHLDPIEQIPECAETYPYCNGACPPPLICARAHYPREPRCECVPVPGSKQEGEFLNAPCSESKPPNCQGDCPPGEVCKYVHDGYYERCVCVVPVPKKVKFRDVPLSPGDTLTGTTDASNIVPELDEADNVIERIVTEPPIPTLTEWGLIIFGVVLLGFITYVFLRRRKAVVSLR